MIADINSTRSRLHVLLVPLGSAGDVFPFIGIGAAMRDRGHRVTLLTNPHFEPYVADAGLDFTPLSTEEEYLRGVGNPDLWHPLKGFAFIARELMSNYIREVYQKLEQAIGSGPTIIVAPAAALGARLLNERRGVPLVTLLLQPALVRSMYNSPKLPCTLMGDGVPRWLKRLQYWLGDRLVIDRLLCPELNRARTELGMAPVRGVMREWWTSPERVIGLFPDWFALPQADWPKQLRLTGFPMWDDGDHAPLEPELEQFLAAGPPPIVFTAGSAMMHGRAFFQAATDACRLLKRRGILVAKYPNQTPPDLPPEVRHFRFVPFSRIFPRAAAIVHHGGIGTCAQALAAGVPQLIMPMSHDQPDNAARLERLGVAASILPKQFTAERVAKRLDELLNQSGIATRCHALAARMTETDAVAATCDEIEAVMSLRDDAAPRRSGLWPDGRAVGCSPTA